METEGEEDYSEDFPEEPSTHRREDEVEDDLDDLESFPDETG